MRKRIFYAIISTLTACLFFYFHEVPEMVALGIVATIVAILFWSWVIDSSDEVKSEKRAVSFSVIAHFDEHGRPEQYWLVIHAKRESRVRISADLYFELNKELDI